MVIKLVEQKLLTKFILIMIIYKFIQVEAMQMENHVDFHLNIIMQTIISAFMKTMNILIIKSGVEQMMIQRQFQNGEIVHVFFFVYYYTSSY